jgi:hypothetical protein
LWPEPPPRPFDYAVARADQVRIVPNALRRFWVTDAITLERTEVIARLRVQTAHAQFWVEEGAWHDIRRLQRAALVFETQIYPRVRQALGSEWVPGVDNDPHVLILHATHVGEGVAGYTTSVDEYPRSQEPYSNEAELIVVNLALDVGSRAYYALLARQFANIVHWFTDRNESAWVKQGLADLAVRLTGIQVDGATRAYLAETDTALAVESPGLTTLAQRGAAALLMTYFHEQYLDEGTRALVAEPLNGVAGVEATLSRLGRKPEFEEFFADWLAANYLDSEPGAVPLHTYDSLQLDRPTVAATIDGVPSQVDGWVHQLGVDYIVIRAEEDIQVAFRGVTETRLLDPEPQEGDWYWWSNRADESQCTLTRSFDLAASEKATLGYWVWYDIEPGFDYASVEVSVDGGASWKTVEATRGEDSLLQTPEDEWAYTGASGAPPRWVFDTVDLTPYAGAGTVVVRFVYLTDGAITGPGIALDDIRILETEPGAGADASDTEWEAQGFLRTDGKVDQRYLALLIGLGDRVTVERLPFDSAHTATWLVPLGSQAWSEAVLAISGLAPLTGQPAQYSLSSEPAQGGR